MKLLLKMNKLYLLIIFVMSTITACSSSSSQTLTVMERGPGAELKIPVLHLTQNLEPGMVLNVVTTTTADVTQFDIKDISNNILLRMEPRIHKKVVAFNSLSGRWGADEVSSTMPIKKGEKYNLHIAHQLNGYRISVNGEELHFYKHRSQNPGVTFQMLAGGKWYSIAHKLNEPKWAVHQANTGMYSKEFNEHGKESPHEIQFQGSYPLSSIAITGIINSNADNVDFNLTNTADEEIFHFSIRLTENYVARNSHLEGVWGKEERYGGMVFKRNERFTLAIDVDVDYYKVYVDGAEFITYKHRTSYYNIVKLKISAGMTIFKTIYQK